MRHLRRIHAVMLILAGLSLAASVFGFQRAAIALLVVVVCLLVVSLEGLRVLAPREKRP